MNLDDVIKNRRSIRSFDLSKEIAPDVIEQIVEAGTWAPTSCNQQLWSFILINDDAIMKTFVDRAGSSTLVLRAPALIIVTYQDNKTKEVYQNASAAIQNMLLKSYELGLGSLWLNSFGNEKIIKKIVNIPEKQKIVSFILLGYPSRIPNPPKRRSIKEVLHYNYHKSQSKTINYTHNPAKWSLDNIREYQKFISRKTEQGSIMDIFHKEEANILTPFIEKEINNKILILFPYDGSLIKHISSSLRDTCFDCLELSEETVKYTIANLAGEDANYFLASSNGKFPIPEKSYDRIYILFRLERFDNAARIAFIRECSRILRDNGKVLLIFRKDSIIMTLLMAAIRLFSGDDIRKSAVFSFFGPYEPLSVSCVKEILKRSGFVRLKKYNFFFLPPFVVQILKLFYQYVKSGGRNFLHRKEYDNIYTRCMDTLVGSEINKRFGNSICVMEGYKSDS